MFHILNYDKDENLFAKSCTSVSLASGTQSRRSNLINPPCNFVQPLIH